MNNISRRKFLKSGAVLAASAALGLGRWNCSWASGKTHFPTFTDIHFNPFKGLSATGAKELFNTDYTGWHSIFQKHGPDNYGELGQKSFETNWKLLDAAFVKMKGAAQEAGGVDFILFTGDFLAHAFNKSMKDKHKKAFGKKPSQDTRNRMVRNTLGYVSHCLGKHLPDVPVYFCLGNNDGYYKKTKTGHYSSDYTIECGDEFLDQTAEIFRKNYLKGAAGNSPFLETYKKWGAYSLVMPGTSNRLISLNTNLFSYKRTKYLDSPWKGTTDMLDWFKSELAHAEASGQTVWLLAHIPPGVWERGFYYHNAAPYAFNDIMLDILERYAKVIRFISMGHTHMDDFHVDAGPGNKAGSFSLHITPAVSPQFGNNPGFTLSAFDNSSLRVTGIKYDYLKFKEKGQTKAQDWGRYSFADKYPGAGAYGAAALYKVWQKIEQPGSAFAASYAHHYNVESPLTPEVAKHPVQAACRIGCQRKADYDRCVADSSKE